MEEESNGMQEKSEKPSSDWGEGPPIVKASQWETAATEAAHQHSLL